MVTTSGGNVVVSTVVMGVVAEGTRAEIEEQDDRWDAEAFARADATGTSDPPGPYQEYTWTSHDVVLGADCFRQELPSYYGLPNYPPQSAAVAAKAGWINPRGPR